MIKIPAKLQTPTARISQLEAQMNALRKLAEHNAKGVKVLMELVEEQEGGS